VFLDECVLVCVDPNAVRADGGNCEGVMWFTGCELGCRIAISFFKVFLTFSFVILLFFYY
jgi:hypothetical protein